MEKLYEIAKETGVKNVRWSGMTKRVENSQENADKKDYTVKSC